MNAKHLIAMLALTLAAGATFAALKQGPVETPPSAAATATDCAETPIARIVVTARRDPASADATPVARVVVTARRSESADIVSAARTETADN